MLKTVLRFGAPLACALTLATLRAFAADKPTIDTGDTAWLLVATALVLMMNIPGLALFYAGMVRKKNVLATAVQAFAVAALVTVLWFIVGYSLAFTDGGDLNGVIGSLSRAFGAGLQGSVHELAKTVPENVFLMYQATFAIITPAIIAGAFAERMKFSAMMWFMALWLLFVYVPVAHWVWGGGFLGAAGVLDFAGGLVVHLNAGIAGLVCCLVIGKRQGYGTEYMAPHNLVLTLIGTSLLWVGWFGFNAGSALSLGRAGGQRHAQHPHLGRGRGAGLDVDRMGEPRQALGAGHPVRRRRRPRHHHAGRGLRRAVGRHGDRRRRRRWSATGPRSCSRTRLGYDDSLDVFGVHGVGGILGTILAGVFATRADQRRQQGPAGRPGRRQWRPDPDPALRRVASPCSAPSPPGSSSRSSMPWSGFGSPATRRPRASTPPCMASGCNRRTQSLWLGGGRVPSPSPS